MSRPDPQSSNTATWIILAAIGVGVLVVIIIVLSGRSTDEGTSPTATADEPVRTTDDGDIGHAPDGGADASTGSSATTIEVEVPAPTPIRPPAELRADTTLRAEPDLAAMARQSIAAEDPREALRLTRRLGSITTQAELYYEIYQSTPESNDGLQAANEWIETQHELGRQSTEAFDVCVMLSELQMRDADCDALAR